MKKILFLIICIVSMTGCKKDNWTPDIKIGTKFIYKGNLNFLKKADGTVPTNPFTVDSLAPNAYKGYAGYWVSSANGLVYVFDPVVIRDGLK